MKKTEKIAPLMQGIYRDRLTGPDNQLIWDSGWTSNTIVTNSRILLAGLMKNESSSGIQYLAVGQGDPSWDVQGIPATDPDKTTELFNPYSKKYIDVDQVIYLDNDADPKPTVVPTTRLQITVTLEPGYPPPASVDRTTYPLREFGLFGCLGQQKYMINCVRHPVIHKDTSAKLIRIMRLYF